MFMKKNVYKLEYKIMIMHSSSLCINIILISNMFIYSQKLNLLENCNNKYYAKIN